MRLHQKKGHKGEARATFGPLPPSCLLKRGREEELQVAYTGVSAPCVFWVCRGAAASVDRSSKIQLYDAMIQFVILFTYIYILYDIYIYIYVC